MRDDRDGDDQPENDGDIMAGDRRIARTDSALPDWYVSDTSYRPIPIAWFAGALFLQVLVQPAIVFLFGGLFGLPRLVLIGIAALVSGFIWQFTWERGMHGASRAWQWATALMLVFFFGITAISLLG